MRNPNPAILASALVLTLHLAAPPSAPAAGSRENPARVAGALRACMSGPSGRFDEELLSTFARASGRSLVPVEADLTGAVAVARGEADLAGGLLLDDVSQQGLIATGEVFPTRLVAGDLTMERLAATARAGMLLEVFGRRVSIRPAGARGGP